jgi:hypothetical protein
VPVTDNFQESNAGSIVLKVMKNVMPLVLNLCVFVLVVVVAYYPSTINVSMMLLFFIFSVIYSWRIFSADRRLPYYFYLVLLLESVAVGPVMYYSINMYADPIRVSGDIKDKISELRERLVDASKDVARNGVMSSKYLMERVSEDAAQLLSDTNAIRVKNSYKMSCIERPIEMIVKEARLSLDYLNGARRDVLLEGKYQSERREMTEKCVNEIRAQGFFNMEMLAFKMNFSNIFIKPDGHCCMAVIDRSR